MPTQSVIEREHAHRTVAQQFNPLRHCHVVIMIVAHHERDNVFLTINIAVGGLRISDPVDDILIVKYQDVI